MRFFGPLVGRALAVGGGSGAAGSGSGWGSGSWTSGGPEPPSGTGPLVPSALGTCRRDLRAAGAVAAGLGSGTGGSAAAGASARTRSPGSPGRQGGAGCLQGLGHETLQRLDVAKPGKPRSAGQRLEGLQVAQLPGARRSLGKLQHLIEDFVLGLDLQGVLEDQPAKLAHDPPPLRFLEPEAPLEAPHEVDDLHLPPRDRAPRALAACSEGALARLKSGLHVPELLVPLEVGQ